jgi:hypothetical protein
MLLMLVAFAPVALLTGSSVVVAEACSADDI